MAHTFRVLTEYADQQKYIAPIMERMGSQIPAEGQGVIFAEFDEAGEVVAFQVLQSALFAEGLWARDGSAHLRTLWNMLLKWVDEFAGGSGRGLLTMTRSDEQGQRIGRAVQRMGFRDTGWKVYRRDL